MNSGNVLFNGIAAKGHLNTCFFLLEIDPKTTIEIQFYTGRSNYAVVAI